MTNFSSILTLLPHYTYKFQAGPIANPVDMAVSVVQAEPGDIGADVIVKFDSKLPDDMQRADVPRDSYFDWPLRATRRPPLRPRSYPLRLKRQLKTVRTGVRTVAIDFQEFYGGNIDQSDRDINYVLRGIKHYVKDINEGRVRKPVAHIIVAMGAEVFDVWRRNRADFGRRLNFPTPKMRELYDMKTALGKVPLDLSSHETWQPKIADGPIEERIVLNAVISILARNEAVQEEMYHWDEFEAMFGNYAAMMLERVSRDGWAAFDVFPNIRLTALDLFECVEQAYIHNRIEGRLETIATIRNRLLALASWYRRHM